MNTKSYIVEWHTTVPYGTVRERARFGYTVVDDCVAAHDAVAPLTGAAGR